MHKVVDRLNLHPTPLRSDHHQEHLESCDRLDGMRLASGQPVALMRNFLPLALEEVVTEEGLKTTGLYQLLRQGGIHLRLASQTIGARSAQRREARLLKVPTGSPLLTMRRISYDDAGQPVEYGSHVYPAERYSFEMSVVSDSTT